MLFVCLGLWNLGKPEMDLVSVDYNKPVARQVGILCGAVFVWLLSVSLWSPSSSILSNFRDALLKVIPLHLF